MTNSSAPTPASKATEWQLPGDAPEHIDDDTNARDAWEAADAMLEARTQ